MIARIWHGYTLPENADTYESMLKPQVLPDIDKVPGYLGTYFIRRNLGSEVEFCTIMLWDSLDSIKAHAGNDYERSIVPEERRKVLSRWDERAAHYEVVTHP
ncbi:MAG TPA: antibiotic biosynthesis monooxygenase [Terriglobales bacterium]